MKIFKLFCVLIFSLSIYAPYAFSDGACSMLLSEKPKVEVESKLEPILDVQGVSGKTELFRELIAAERTKHSAHGQKLSEAELLEISLLFPRFNMYAIPEDVLASISKTLVDLKISRRLAGLNLEETLTLSLVNFTLLNLDYQQAVRPREKETALREMRKEVERLSRAKNVLLSPEAMWHLASMKYTLKDIDGALKDLLLVFRSEPMPSTTLINAVVEVSQKAGIQLSDSVIAKISEYRSASFNTHFDVNNQWGPYVTYGDEKIALEFRSFFPE